MMDLNLPEHASQYLRSLRGNKQPLDRDIAQGYSIEHEPSGMGQTASCLTVFLTGAECKFTCSMCDLWQYTLDERTPIGSLPRQIESTLSIVESRGERADWIKLYNASNFFDLNSVPAEDLEPIAKLCEPFQRVIIENHPILFRSDLVRDRAIAFANALSGTLEVAMGLESVNPEAMKLLNKQMHPSDFEVAVEYLSSMNIDSRSFVLLQPPGDEPSKSVEWSCKAVEFSIQSGVRHCSIIPTRPSTGWTTELYHAKLWTPPTAFQLEAAIDEALSLCKSSRSIVTVDLWNWSKLAGLCDRCRDARRQRLESINTTQKIVEPVACDHLN